MTEHLFTTEELWAMASNQSHDLYHRDLIRWAALRIEELEERLYGIADDTYPHTVQHDVRAGTTLRVRIPKKYMVR
jgi:hypothetical protein